MHMIIGRKDEIAQLNRLYNSGKAEFVAVYGRRRIGKTFLVDETFKGRITFRHAGLSPLEDGGRKDGFLKKQLKHFYNSLLLQGMPRSRQPQSWLDAFFLLEQYLQSIDDGSRQLLFLDELPWLDTQRSGFITALEAFWNSWGCHRDNLMVVVCGSANSWILDKLINNHGGLYNRITYEIKLTPFSLQECRTFFKANNILLSKYDIAQSYMILGGIPYYLGYFEPGKSLAQNIDNLFFAPNAKLRDEFTRLFASIFSNPIELKNIVMALSGKNRGLTRQELIETIGVSNGGTLSQNLRALLASDFIIKYVPFGESKKNVHYKLVDAFCMFFLKFVDKYNALNESFWLDNITSPQIVIWRGFAFENLCFQHIKQIKAALGIAGVSSSQSSWTKHASDTGTQIDMLIERKDNVINLCEMKFYSGEFIVNKDYYKNMLNKQTLLAEGISSKMAIHNTLITTYGLQYNEYSSIFVNVLTLENLFC